MLSYGRCSHFSLCISVTHSLHLYNNLLFLYIFVQPAYLSHIVYIYTTIYFSYTSLFDLLWVLYLMIFLLFESMSTRSIFPPIRSPALGKRQYALSSRMPWCCRCSHFSHNEGHFCSFWVPLTYYYSLKCVVE